MPFKVGDIEEDHKIFCKILIRGSDRGIKRAVYKKGIEKNLEMNEVMAAEKQRCIYSGR